MTTLKNHFGQIVDRAPPGAVADAMGLAALCFLVVAGFSFTGPG